MDDDDVRVELDAEGDAVVARGAAGSLGAADEGGTVIARSDSNGEDLEDFAGAGLYDSITAAPTESRVVDYAQTPVVWNADARDALIRRVAEVASAVAASRGKPQDIEGAIAGDRLVLLQTRRQIC